MNTWHVTPTDLEAYRSGGAQPLLAHSVEAHLLRCAACRQALARTATPGAAAASTRRWQDVSAAVDARSTRPLLRLGTSTGPLLAALAVAVLLVVVTPLLAVTGGDARTPVMLLAVAPLAPMLAVVLGYRREAEPAGEMALAAPVAGIRLVARRALLVSAASLPVGVLAALASDLPTEAALAWVLPGLALSGLVLLAGTTRLDPATTAAAAGGAWTVGVGILARRERVEVVVDLLAGAPTQLTALLLAVVAFALVLARRDHVSYRRSL